jgi:hypothetical protein
MAIKRGVSLYSYQQSQFFRELDLEAQIREVGENLFGADGIEIIDEMSLRYPDPGEEFVRQWFSWMERYGTVPVTMDVGMDVLQFRNHVMSHEECADRLRHDIRLAKRLGFKNVRVLSVVPLDILRSALPLAESLDIRLGKEIHQPMSLEGPEVTEILEFVDQSGTRHLGIVPDFGIFGTRPSEVLLANFERRGAQAAATEASVALAQLVQSNDAPFPTVDLSIQTAGNIRSAFTRFLATGQSQEHLADTFHGVRKFTDARVPDAKDIDYTVVTEGLLLSRTSPDTLRQIARHVTGVHGKFNNMSPIPGKPGQYQDIAINYEDAVAALKAGGFEGYINSEYEGQRYFHDRTRAEMMSEVEQVRRHQEMLKRLIGE